MNIDEQNSLVEKMKTDNEFPISTTPRTLINAFGFFRRTPNCKATVDDFLEKNKIAVDPSYVDAWIDSKITLSKKLEMATTKISQEHIKKIMLLEAANNPPTTISKSDHLQKAITIMMVNDFSQLPVTSSTRGADGYISWSTIGSALANGVQETLVQHYMNNDIVILDQSTPLLSAIKIICERDFAVVQSKEKTLSGIVTVSDITQQFITITEPFLLIEQIENHLRQLLNRKVPLDSLKKWCARNESENIKSIDDLTFGEYIRIMEHDENWKKLNLRIDKKTFLQTLHSIREIRNDVMHFEPEWITPDKRTELQNVANFLNTINTFSAKAAV